MRMLILMFLAGMLLGCANARYYDTNPAVDARAECAGTGLGPSGGPVPSWCQREQGMKISSEPNERMEIDFGSKDDDGD